MPKDFLEGKRMRYMNPVRVYFLASLLLLFILQIDGGNSTMIRVNDKSEKTENAGLSLKEKNNSPVELILSDSTATDSSKEENIDEGIIPERMIDFGTKHPETEADEALDSLGMENTFWNRFLYTQSIKVSNFDDEEFSRVFYSKIFWVLFLFLPLLAFILHLLYLRREFYYPEHLFFAFYTQSVLFILISIGYLISYWTNSRLYLVLSILIFSIYLVLALKKFYEQNWGKTLFKFFIYNLFSIPAFIAFFIASALVVFIFI